MNFSVREFQRIFFVMADGHVAPSLHRESTDSLICACIDHFLVHVCLVASIYPCKYCGNFLSVLWWHPSLLVSLVPFGG